MITRVLSFVLSAMCLLDLDPEAQAVMEMMGKNPKFHNLKEFLLIQFEY